MLAPNSDPVIPMDIYGFTTDELHNALTVKAQKDTGRTYVFEEIPALLDRLHREMANGQFDVSYYYILHIKFYHIVKANIFFSCVTN